MKTKIGQKTELKLNSYDELFGETKAADVQDVYISELYDFEKHPFYVNDDEDMAELVQSVKEKGVLSPLIIRPRRAGGYEVVSGHRRRHAAEKAGLFKVPALIRELSDEDAVDIMVYSNFQRSHILPSEKAFAYKLQMETVRHAGRKGKSSPQEIGRKYGDNARKVQRYIRLTYLRKELLNLVDRGKLTLQAGYALSFISPDEQKWVWKAWLDLKKLPAGRTAEKIRSQSEDGVLTEEMTRLLIQGKTRRTSVVTLQRSRIEEYIPPDYDEEQIEEIICRLLQKWRDDQMIRGE